MEKEKIVVPLRDKVAVLILTHFGENEINTEELTQIQYHNIMGEILTCSALLNRVGNMLAEIDDILESEELEFEISYAQLEQRKRKSLEFETKDAKGKVKVKTPTNPEVEAAVKTSKEYRDKKLELLKIKKKRNIINSFYWSVKSKDEKLNKLTEKLRPEDFENEIVEGRVNGIMIRISEKAVK